MKKNYFNSLTFYFIALEDVNYCNTMKLATLSFEAICTKWCRDCCNACFPDQLLSTFMCFCDLLTIHTFSQWFGHKNLNTLPKVSIIIWTKIYKISYVDDTWTIIYASHLTVILESTAILNFFLYIY